MGYVAHCLARDIIAPGIIGRMAVNYIGNRTDKRMHTPEFNLYNRLINGTLSLIPGGSDFTIFLSANQ